MNALAKLDAELARMTPGQVYGCVNCRGKRSFALPDLVCAECAQEPAFAAAVEAFNARQARRLQPAGGAA